MKREGSFYAEQLQIDQYQHDRLMLAKRACELCGAAAFGLALGFLFAGVFW